jgi:hypothetical protein
VAVSVGGVVNVEATSSGWTNTGAVAGLLTIATLVLRGFTAPSRAITATS